AHPRLLYNGTFISRRLRQRRAPGTGGEHSYGDPYPYFIHSAYQERAPAALGGKDGGTDSTGAHSLGGWLAGGVRPAVRRDGVDRHPDPAQPGALAWMFPGTFAKKRRCPRGRPHLHLL